MGRYVATAELLRRVPEARLVELSDDLGVGTVDAARVDEAIADAEAEVDAYLAERYALPLASVPALVVRLAADLAVWQLYGRRQVVDEAVEARHKAAVQLLGKLAAGEVSLGMPTAQTPTLGATTTNKSDEDQLFGPAVLDQF